MAIYLSYSTNVHPAESLDELSVVLREQVAPIMRRAGGSGRAPVNLRLGMRQVDELLSHPPLPGASGLSDEILSAPPSPACRNFLALLDELNLDVVSINAFPIREFHAPRVKEQVYSPPWTDGGRALYSLKIAKALTHFMARPGIDRAQAAISVPAGVFKGQYGDSEEVRAQCAHFLTECVRELARLERLTGRTVRLGLEPEPLTTAETCGEMKSYYELLLAAGREKFPLQLGIKRAQAEELVRKFITVNLDLCHQAVEFEDPVADLKAMQAAGIAISGLHLSAALKLADPGVNLEALSALKGLDEPRFLHQVVARKHDGNLVRFADLPHLWDAAGLKRMGLPAAPDVFRQFAELRCHFHVPLSAASEAGAACTAGVPPARPLGTTVDAVGPALRYAVQEKLTDNFVLETYTWNVLAALAAQGNAAARALGGQGAQLDVAAGLVKELEYCSSLLPASAR